MSDEQQLSRVPAALMDWQTRAVEALRTVKEQHLALAHQVAANGELQGQITALSIEADRAAAELARLRELTKAQEAELTRLGNLLRDYELDGHGMADDLLNEQIENGELRATIARVRDLAQRHANLSVSNGSWQMASRHCGAQILKALEGK